MTTLSSFLPVSSAITLTWGLLSGGSTSMCAVEPAWESATPLANDAPTTGIVTVAPSGRSVPTIRPSRVGSFPWLKMITASAPAFCAFSALMPKLHVPRWIRAMSLGPLKSRPAKSLASQPLVLARGGTRLMSTGMTGPVISPNPEPVKAPVSYVAETGVSCWSTDGGVNSYSNSSSVTSHPAASSLSTTYSTLAVYPGRPAARLPPFASAIAWNAA